MMTVIVIPAAVLTRRHRFSRERPTVSLLFIYIYDIYIYIHVHHLLGYTI